MPVNDFENDTTTTSTWMKDFTNFDYHSNLNYRYSSADELMADTDTLIKMIRNHHEVQVPRLSVLDDYYKGQNTNIKHNDRRKEEEKADYRPAHNFAKIGCQFDVGYNTANPIKFDTEHDQTLEMITEFNDENDIDGLNSELWLDMDKYGRAYELHYRDEDFNDYVVLANVFETFVVYDTSIKREPIMAVRYPRARFGKHDEGFNLTIYTDKEVIEYEETTFNSMELVEKKRTPHAYGMVPIIESQPNRYRQGLYEEVLSLIDLYDAAQADTANYMSDLSNAILVIQGDFDSQNMTIDDYIKQKNANMLLLENGLDVSGNKTQLSAGYIYKQYDVQGTEAYKKRLMNDIHKIMNIPDLNDENFAGVQSGEAMKYKLFGFEQMTRVKQRMFDKFLKRRYQLVANVKKESSDYGDLEIDSVSIQFTPNMPKAIKEELEMLTKAGMEISQETLVGLASFIDDAKEELDRIEDERAAAPQYDMEFGETDDVHR